MSDVLSEGSDGWLNVPKEPAPESAAGAGPSQPASAESHASETNGAMPGDAQGPPAQLSSEAGGEDSALDDASEHAGAAAAASACGDTASVAGSELLPQGSQAAWDAGKVDENDLHLQVSENPVLPPERRDEVINIAIVGRPQTGKTSLCRNLFGPLTGDPKWTPSPSRTCDKASFRRDCWPVVTNIVTPAAKKVGEEGVLVDANIDMHINVLEYPSLPDTSTATLDALLADWAARDEDYAEQQRTPYLDSEAREDRRVHVVIYCLPQRTHLEADDAAAMKRLFAAKPGIPVMFQGDTFDFRRLRECADDFVEKRADAGFAPYEPPADVTHALFKAMRKSGGCWTSERTLEWPLHLVLGDSVDPAVCRYPHTRYTRAGDLNAYCSTTSDLPVLRRLLTEIGFYDLKRQSLLRYCVAQKAKAEAAAAARSTAVGSQATPQVASLGTQRSEAPVDPFPPVHVPTALDAERESVNGETQTDDEFVDPPAPPPEAGVPFNEAEHTRVSFADTAARSPGDGTMRTTLREVGGDRTICIRVGDPEGRQMLDAQNRRDSPRPSAYDVLASVMAAFGLKIERVVIVECRSTVFYACVHVRGPGVGVKAFDARPSTAINMALRDAAAQGAPIFVHKNVMAQHARGGARRG